MKSDPIFQKMLMLDRLEELREDMEELDINSLAELIQRIAGLEREVGDVDASEDDDGSV